MMGAGVCQCAPRPRSVSIVYACVYMCRSAAPGQGRPAGRAARVSCPSLLAEGGGASYDWGLSERLAGGWWWRSMDGRTPTAAVRGLGRRGIGGRGADHERVGTRTAACGGATAALYAPGPGGPGRRWWLTGSAHAAVPLRFLCPRYIFLPLCTCKHAFT